MTVGTRGAGGAAEGSPEGLAPRRAPQLFSGAGRLPDGPPVRVRPLAAEDRSLLLAGFASLSLGSRRSRFQQGVSDAQFERMLPVLLDTVDQRSHVALVLYADGQPIGVGRLRRFTSHPDVADLAVTVADDLQGPGAGSVLARELLDRAGYVREIQTVVGQDNPASLRMLARLGQLRSDCAHGTCDVIVQVSDSAAARR